MELRIIELNVDKSKEIHHSQNCQMLLKTYDEYYKTIGYNLPWVGYFVVKEDRIVGFCSFTGQPKDGKVKSHIGHLKNMKDKASLCFHVKNFYL